MYMAPSLSMPAAAINPMTPSRATAHQPSATASTHSTHSAWAVLAAMSSTAGASGCKKTKVCRSAQHAGELHTTAGCRWQTAIVIHAALPTDHNSSFHDPFDTFPRTRADTSSSRWEWIRHGPSAAQAMETGRFRVAKKPGRNAVARAGNADRAVSVGRGD